MKTVSYPVPVDIDEFRDRFLRYIRRNYRQKND
jgi:hypothetical protein